jgi:uncharacterized protein GlcG (DUF336 family)
MTNHTKPFAKLTHEGALAIINAAVAQAEEMGIPFCISVVDDGGLLKGFVRMDGAKFLSIESSMRKAMTAASAGNPTGNVPEEVQFKLAHATDGKLTNLQAGLPLIADGQIVGGIGVGSGTGEQDLVAAKAGVAAFEAAL